MTTIANGMTVKVRDDVKVPRELLPMKNSGRVVKLELCGSMSSRVLDDGSVMIKGLGYFEPNLFEECVEEIDNTYEVIIHTQNVFEQGGAYQKYDNVLKHSEEQNGVRVVTESGEWFHPWSYDGGIRAVFVPN